MSGAVMGLAAWLLAGGAGSALTLEFFHRRGEHPLPITIGDIAFWAAMSLFGPLNLIVGVIFFLGWLARKVSMAAGLKWDRVVFPRAAP